MTTTHVRASDTAERCYLYDASEHVLGRMAAQIAMQLQGKDRPTYTPSENAGAHVVVIHAKRAKVLGKKELQKEYDSYSGYPGGRKVLGLEDMRERRPKDIVTLAVRRMLPKGRLGRNMLKRLKVYADAEHPHDAQKPERVDTIRK